MVKATQPALRLKDSNGKRFSGDWQEKTLGEVSLVIMGSSLKSESYNNMQNGVPLFQGKADIENRKTSPRIWTTEIMQKCYVNDVFNVYTRSC